MNIYVDIDNTICIMKDSDGVTKYEKAIPLPDRIAYMNALKDAGHRITYWTARGGHSGLDHTEITKRHLAEWGVKHDELRMGKPSYDLLIDDKTQHPDLLQLPRVRKTRPGIVPKAWGYETVFTKNDSYCGKILHFFKDAKNSMHYHCSKSETLFVMSGKFLLKYVDTRTADVKELTFEVGESIVNEKGEPHQILCLEEGDLFEVSNTDIETDNYRVMKGDSQTVD